MKKDLRPGLAAAAVFATGLVVVTGTAYGADAEQCVARAGTAAVHGAWVAAGHSAWSIESTGPTDPDGESGQDNLANVVQVGKRETRTVEDSPAQENVITPAHWQRYSWTGGPHTADAAPGFPSADWQPNVQGDPHKVGHGGAYFESHGNDGNGDWFYLEWVPAVTQVLPAVTHLEYRWELETRVNAPAVDPVECDGDGGGEPPATPVETPTTRTPAKPGTGTNPGTGTAPALAHAAPAGQAVASEALASHPRRARHQRPVSTAATVPTVIDAGL